MKTIVKTIAMVICLLLFTVDLNTGKESAYTYQPRIIKTYETIYHKIVGTVYHPEKRQTDNTPFLTADNSVIDPSKINQLRWVALSRDLINHQGKYRQWYGKIAFGDTIYIESPKDTLGLPIHPEVEGWWVVHDTMNKRYKNCIDFLQPKNGLYNKWYNLTIKRKTDIFVFVLEKKAE